MKFAVRFFLFATFLFLGWSLSAQEAKSAKPAPAAEPKPAAVAKPDAPKPAVAPKPVAESKPAAEPKPAATPKPTATTEKKAKDADEAREMLKTFARDKFQEAFRAPMQKAVNDILGKTVFDYTHEKIWFPVRKEVRDYTCLNYFLTARKMLYEKIGGEKISKENIAKFKEEIGKTITDSLTPDVMQKTREGYDKHMTKDVEKEGLRLARDKANFAAAKFLETPTVSDIKARVHQQIIMQMDKIAGDNIRPGQRAKMPEMVTENAFKNCTQNMSSNMCETMATTMFQTRKERMKESMAEHMAGHLLKHVNDFVWKKMEEQAGKKFSDISDADWKKLAEQGVAELAKETETPEHLKRSYDLRWNNYIKEKESLTGPRGKNENRGKVGETAPDSKSTTEPKITPTPTDESSEDIKAKNTRGK